MNAIIKADFQGHTVQFNNDGWFNATAAAAHFGKQPYEWLRSPETIKYIQALEGTYGKIPYVKTSKARKDRGGGTWMHPKLGVAFARWLSVDFAVWCDHQIELIIHGKKDDVDWKRLRHAASSSNKLLNGVLQSVRKAIGKKTEQRHYINEAKLVNWALKGKYQGLNRDELSEGDLDLLAKLEMENSILIASNIDRDERKQRLTALAQSHQLQIGATQ